MVMVTAGCWSPCQMLVIITSVTLLLPPACSTPLVTPPRRINYSGHQVVRVYPDNEDQLEEVMDMVDDVTYQVDFWGDTEPKLGGSHRRLDLHLPPASQLTFTLRLDQSHITWHILIPDLQLLIDRELSDYDDDRHNNGRLKRSINDTSYTPGSDVTRLFYDFSVVGQYVRHEQINDWMDTAVNAHPDIAEVVTIGTSYEGRPMKVIRLGFPANRASYFRKPGIWIDAGIHGREWVAPATANFIIHKLLSQYGKCRCVTHLVNAFDWYILPVVNPDGYEYTHSVDRLWRKTRRQVADCMGVDANRNFDYHWYRFSRCVSTYPGEFPFSEPETRAMSGFLLEHADAIKAYISLHSYSQMWLHPWGYSRVPPPDYDDIVRVANRSVRALEATHGKRYIVGSPADILYPASGTSMDWAAGVAGIKYSVSVELRDTGTYGFLLPRTEVVPTAQEAWAGISAMAKEILKEL